MVISFILSLLLYFHHQCGISLLTDYTIAEQDSTRLTNIKFGTSNEPQALTMAV